MTVAQLSELHRNYDHEKNPNILNLIVISI